MRVCSVFSGIGGFEVGLGRAGFNTVLMCEKDSAARAVLEKRFPDVQLEPDITKLKELPACDVVTAGWPCQDLSQAGRTMGITGRNSNSSNTFSGSWTPLAGSRNTYCLRMLLLHCTSTADERSASNQGT